MRGIVIYKWLQHSTNLQTRSRTNDSYTALTRYPRSNNATVSARVRLMQQCLTDRAASLANVIEELLPDSFHNTEKYANNRVENDHGRLKSRLRPMRGLQRTGLRA